MSPWDSCHARLTSDHLVIILTGSLAAVEEIHESYRHFRNSAVALSVTVIGVSGAMLLKMEILLASNDVVYLPISIALMVVFVVCILQAFFLQYRHFEDIGILQTISIGGRWQTD